MAREEEKGVAHRTDPSSATSSPVFSYPILLQLSGYGGKAQRQREFGFSAVAHLGLVGSLRTTDTLNNSKLGAPTTWGTKTLLQLFLGPKTCFSMGLRLSDEL